MIIKEKKILVIFKIKYYITLYNIMSNPSNHKIINEFNKLNKFKDLPDTYINGKKEEEPKPDSTSGGNRKSNKNKNRKSNRNQNIKSNRNQNRKSNRNQNRKSNRNQNRKSNRNQNRKSNRKSK